MARLLNINFVCKDPIRLSEFWAAVLGYEIEEVPQVVLDELKAMGREPDLAAAIRDVSDGGPRIFFQKKIDDGDRVASTTDNTLLPIHLDVASDDREVEVDRLRALGATVVGEKVQRIGNLETRFVVMRDPEGNDFWVH